MSDSVMYPEAGRWVNSYLVGANAYKIMSTPEEAQQLLLDDSGDFLQTGTEHHYIQVRCRNENKPLWLVPFRVKQEELLRVSDVLEQIQMGRILREGFFWPFDLVRSDEMQGYVLHPFSMDAYPSVRRFLPSSDTPRWTIAVHLFRRIGQLHREGLTLNGFGRDQVRVEYGTNQVYLVPGETISRVSQIGAAFRGDFLSVPQVVEQQLEKNGIVLDGRVRDIFSAAVIAFYLLFYTHPFIGEEYSHLMREQYLEYFQSRPVFLFDAGGHNGTGHHQFGAEITAQWWRAQPELRQLFSDFFAALCAGQIDENAPWNDTENWVRCLLEDAAVNDNDKSRTSYERELEKVQVEDALKHPNWSMGHKITIDSSTMVNKGLEVMEAGWLFDVSLDQIQVVIQPASIIHSMIEYEDGAVIAQLGTPDMKLPIQYALYYPERRFLPGDRLDFTKLREITFDVPDPETFKGLKLAYQAGKTGGSMPTVFNAANEMAVSLFLKKKIPYLTIPDMIQASMEHHKKVDAPDVDQILAAEAETYDFIHSKWNI